MVAVEKANGRKTERRANGTGGGGKRGRETGGRWFHANYWRFIRSQPFPRPPPKRPLRVTRGRVVRATGDGSLPFRALPCASLP